MCYTTGGDKKIKVDFQPYLVECHLREDEPKQAVDALNEYVKWFE